MSSFRKSQNLVARNHISSDEGFVLTNPTPPLRARLATLDLKIQPSPHVPQPASHIDATCGIGIDWASAEAVKKCGKNQPRHASGHLSQCKLTLKCIQLYPVQASESEEEEEEAAAAAASPEDGIPADEKATDCHELADDLEKPRAR